MEKTIYQEIRKLVGEEYVLADEPLSRHTSFRIGGPADLFVMIRTEDQLRVVLDLCRENGEAFYVMGNGTNLLAGDAGFRGVIIQLGKAFSGLRSEGTVLEAQAGTLLSVIAKEALRLHLTGFEFASGIPGTLGGAVVMNAGAYGGEMKDVTECVRLMTPAGEILEKTGDEMGFGYRTSLAAREDFLVLGARLRFREGDEAAIRDRMEELKEKRTSKQPLDLPSAGSTLKRPEGYFAGKLIMDAGLAGFRIGGAMVSPKHCGFVVNTGGATAKDVHDLIACVQDRVMETAGVRLEPEVKFIGV